MSEERSRATAHPKTARRAETPKPTGAQILSYSGLSKPLLRVAFAESRSVELDINLMSLSTSCEQPARTLPDMVGIAAEEARLFGFAARNPTALEMEPATRDLLRAVPERFLPALALPLSAFEMKTPEGIVLEALEAAASRPARQRAASDREAPSLTFACLALLKAQQVAVQSPRLACLRYGFSEALSQALAAADPSSVLEACFAASPRFGLAGPQSDAREVFRVLATHTRGPQPIAPLVFPPQLGRLVGILRHRRPDPRPDSAVSTDWVRRLLSRAGGPGFDEESKAYWRIRQYAAHTQSTFAAMLAGQQLREAIASFFPEMTVDPELGDRGILPGKFRNLAGRTGRKFGTRGNVSRSSAAEALFAVLYSAMPKGSARLDYLDRCDCWNLVCRYFLSARDSMAGELATTTQLGRFLAFNRVADAIKADGEALGAYLANAARDLLAPVDTVYWRASPKGRRPE